MPISSTLTGSVSNLPSLNHHNSSLSSLETKKNSINASNIKLGSVIGKGAFGVVYKGYLETNDLVAIKQVKQDKRYKNRELDILQVIATNPHENIILLLSFFKTFSFQGLVTLHLVFKMIPVTLASIIKDSCNSHSIIPLNKIKIYISHLFKGLHHLDSLNIVHRDIKPTNLLIDQQANLLKICDFGSAKVIPNIKLNKNISYICSRFYRAPELIFGSEFYKNKIDIWSAGCVLAELFLLKPIFKGNSINEHLLNIFKLLGVPSCEDINEMLKYSKNESEVKKIKLPKLHKKINLQEIILTRYQQYFSVVKDNQKGMVDGNEDSKIRENKKTKFDFNKDGKEIKEVTAQEKELQEEINEAIDLIYKIFVYNPEKRYCAVKCLNSIFLCKCE